MEVYYKDLISKDASLEKLIDDLSMVVQGVDEYVRAAQLTDGTAKAEIVTRLEKLQESCRHAREQAVAGAVATDKLFKKYPYSTLGLVFGLGLLSAFFW